MNYLKYAAVQHNRLTINKARNTLKVFRASPPGPAPGNLVLVCQDLLGQCSTAFALVLEDLSHPFTNGDLLLDWLD